MAFSRLSGAGDPRMASPLHPYQKEAIRFALKRDCVGLLLDMGLGKTLISVAVMDILHKRDPSMRWLVVAPAMVARDTWSDELDKWADIHHLDYVVLRGGPAKRLELLGGNQAVTIISENLIAWLDDTVKTWPWTGLVIDELSGYRNTKSKRFKALKGRREGFSRVIGLTGTPAPKGLIDLYPEMLMVDGGRALGTTVTGFRTRWFHPGAHDGHIVFEWLPNAGAMEGITRRLRNTCISMSASDHLPGLPELTVIEHRLTMPPEAMKRYRVFHKEKVLELADDPNIKAKNPAILSNKLTQCAAGQVYVDPPENTRTEVMHKVKDEALARIVTESHGQSILVFYRFKFQWERLKETYPHIRHVKERGVQAAWREGKVPIMAAYPGAAQFGLNIQGGGHIIVWITGTWTPSEWKQANARLHRQGQTDAVIVHALLMRGTVDERMMDVMMGRATQQSAILDTFRA